MWRCRSILACTDFTPCSATALGHAVRLAQRFGASLEVVHVIDTLVVIDLEQALTPLQQDIRDGLVEDAERAWRAFVAGTAGASGVPEAANLPFHVDINNRVEGILHRARQLRSDLLVLGAHGASPPDVGLGSVASGCVRRAEADVLLARDHHAGPFRSIVVGVDFSDTSARAVACAAAIAAQEGAALHLLHVFRPPWEQLHFRALSRRLPPNSEDRLEGELERRLTEFCAPALEGLAGGAPASVHHTVREHHGHRSGLVEHAKDVSADLLVLGTRGRSNIRDVLLGSTAERALRDSACSVLAVKPARRSG